MKVVSPAWLTESVERSVLLNWRDYIFRPGRQRDSAQGQLSTQTSLFPRRTTQLAAPSSHPPLSNQLDQDEVMDPTPPTPPPNQLQDQISFDPTPPTPPSNQLQLLDDAKTRPPSPPPNQLGLRASSEEPVSPSPEGAGDSSFAQKAVDPATALVPEVSKPPFRDLLYSTDPITPEQTAKVPGYAMHKSNPNAQRVMADANWRAAHTSIAPDFIEGYYKNSRLHYLSTWKAELRALVQEAQERVENGTNMEEGDVTLLGDAAKFVGTQLLDVASPDSRKGKKKATCYTDRVIMHCDFDSVRLLLLSKLAVEPNLAQFFVAVGLLSRPELVGKPVAVCHSQGAQGGASSTSEIASASYEARRFGVKGGMR
jgi:DNA repair protein REV1